jgi:hypothetical protein
MDPKILRQRWRHFGLLILLLLLFIVSPIVAPLRYGVLLLNVVAAAALLSRTHLVSPAQSPADSSEREAAYFARVKRSFDPRGSCNVMWSPESST